MSPIVDSPNPLNDSAPQENKYWILWLLGTYAIAMALLEAAVVVYMRRLYYPENPLDLFPLAFLHSYDPRLELAREAATVLMIITVALLAESTNTTRKFAAFLFVFGVWDLFYYVWLKALIDWPRTWLEWDVLFLIPMIWLGPWICPALIALLFAAWGGWALVTKREVRFSARSLAVFVLGAALGLFAFMQPALAVANASGDLTTYMPAGFWWWLFGFSWVLMCVSLWMTVSTPKAEPSI